MAKLSKRQLERYSRTISLNNIGEASQAKLLNSKVLVVGAGGLGSSTILYLSSLGIKSLGIADFDKVSLDNLPRQILYSEEDVGRPKVNVLKDKLSKRNPDTEFRFYNERISVENVNDIIKDYDIVLDCVDNFESEFVLNDACVKANIPLLIAGVSGYQGQVMLISSKSKKDYKSLFSNLPLNISKEDKEKDKPVYPLAVAIVSNIQCNEAIKYILGLGKPLVDEMLVIDVLNLRFDKFKL